MLAHDEHVDDLDRPDIATRYLFDAAMYDAVLLGFALIAPKIKEDLGDSTERLNFANRILLWMAGQVEPDLTFVYLPLVMGGLVVNLFVNPRDDNPWLMVDQLREASRGRARLVSGEALAIFHMMDELLNDAEDQLRRARIPRS